MQRMARLLRNGDQSIALGRRQGLLQKRREDLRQNDLAAHAQHLAQCVDCAVCARLVLELGQDRGHGVVHYCGARVLDQSVERLGGGLAHLRERVGERLLDGGDHLCEIALQLLARRAVQHLCEAEAYALARGAVAGKQALLEDRNDRGQDAVAQLAHELSHGPAGDVAAVVVVAAEVLDDHAHQHAEDALQRLGRVVDHALPHEQRLLAHHGAHVRADDVDGGQHLLVLLLAQRLGDLLLAGLGDAIVVRHGGDVRNVALLASNLEEEVSHELHGALANAPVRVEKTLLQAGQEDIEGGEGELRDNGLRRADADVPHALRLVREAVKDDREHAAEVRLHTVAHAAGREHEEANAALAHTRRLARGAEQDLGQQRVEADDVHEAQHLAEALCSARADHGAVGRDHLLHEPLHNVGELVLAQTVHEVAESHRADAPRLGVGVDERGLDVGQQHVEVGQERLVVGQRRHVASDARGLALHLHVGAAEAAVEEGHDEGQRGRVDDVHEVGVDQGGEGGLRILLGIVQRLQQRRDVQLHLGVADDRGNVAQRALARLLNLLMRVGENLEERRHNLRQAHAQLARCTEGHCAEQLDGGLLRPPCHGVKAGNNAGEDEGNTARPQRAHDRLGSVVGALADGGRAVAIALEERVDQLHCVGLEEALQALGEVLHRHEGALAALERLLVLEHALEAVENAVLLEGDVAEALHNTGDPVCGAVAHVCVVAVAVRNAVKEQVQHARVL
mmetsp:Transcript_12790/g.51049  ORF Transcript_12790/g.51049 Transcript_12790/m.51049 type:complete len:738 (+) Transcript_12790:1697-3910(+)